MHVEVGNEAVEIVTMAVDKYLGSQNYEVRVGCPRGVAQCAHIHVLLEQAAARLIKETMDKKFGTHWHCCIGEGFGFEVTYQQRNMVYVYYGEKLGVLLFKC